MAVFSLSDFADHEQVVFVSDDKSGLKAIIAVHNSNLGPALGGCRMWPYATEEEAVRDVLRLSRGMTYKSAMANLKLGGGKSVIIGNPRTHKTPELLAAFARALEQLNGRYIAAEDSGTSVADMKYMTQFTQHVAGIHDKPSDAGTRSGDPSPATAYGSFIGIKAAVKERLGRDSLDGLRVAVQGVGNVGFDLARQLKEAGAQLWVTDIHREALVQAGKELGATVVAPDEIFGLDVDVFAPCALGAILNDSTIPQLKATIVAGAEASLQKLGTDHLDLLLIHRPDPLMNADEVAEAFISLKQAGKIKHAGVSNFTPHQFALLQSRLPFPLVTNQLEISPLHQEGTLDGALDQCQQLGIKPMAWSCLGGGRLFNDPAYAPLRAELEQIRHEVGAQHIEQVVYAWVMMLPSQPLPLIGSGKRERITAAVAAESIQLSRQQWFRIRKAALGYDVP